MSKQSQLILIYLISISAIFFGLYRYIYDHKIDFNGDNVSYYLLGKAIAQGEGYVNIELKEKPPHGHFPPGYPLIIGGLMKIFPENVNMVKHANGVFLWIGTVCFFFIALKITASTHLSFATSMILIFNAHFLQFSTIMMSEIPFMALLLSSVLLLLYTSYEVPILRNWRFLLLIIGAAFLFHIRTVGIAFFGAIVLSLLYQREWKYAGTSVFIFLLLCLPWQLRNNSLNMSNNYLDQLMQKNPYRVEEGVVSIEDFGKRVLDNGIRYITKEIPNGILSYRHVDYKKSPRLRDWIFGVTILFLFFFGIKSLSFRRHFFVIFVICTLCILLSWPSLWNGPRFLFQLIPFLLLFSLMGFFNLLKTNLKVSLPLAPLLCLVLILWEIPIVKHLNATSKGKFVAGFADYIRLAQWVSENVSDSMTIATRKPQLFHIYSGSYVSHYKRTVDPEEQLAYLKQKGIDFVVVDRLGYASTQRNLVPVIKRYPKKFKEKVKLGNPTTLMLEFHPELGYEGSFDEKGNRTGFGSFVWETGMRYEGDWEENVRSGKGKLIYPDGNILEGEWVVDKLNGTARLFNSEGQHIQNLIFEDNNVSYTQILR